MNIVCVKDSGKTKVFELYSKEGNALLGEIRWYGAWRQYAFMPRGNTVFEKQCLRDITDLLVELMNERKLNKTA